jgi:hypothetical protein
MKARSGDEDARRLIKLMKLQVYDKNRDVFVDSAWIDDD